MRLQGKQRRHGEYKKGDTRKDVASVLKSSGAAKARETGRRRGPRRVLATRSW